jgi:hypothetical protein
MPAVCIGRRERTINRSVHLLGDNSLQDSDDASRVVRYRTPNVDGSGHWLRELANPISDANRGGLNDCGNDARQVQFSPCL